MMHSSGGKIAGMALMTDGAQFSCGLLAVSENTFTNFAN